MLRYLSLLAFGMIALSVTPVDAQIFRRAERQSARAARKAQPSQAQPAAAAKKDKQSPRKNEQQKSQPSPTGITPTAAKRLSSSQPATQPDSRTGSETLAQRFGVFFDPRTRRTILRPLQPTRNNSNQLPQLGQTSTTLARQTRPSSTATPNQADIARASQASTTPPPESLTLNAPVAQLTGSSAQPTVAGKPGNSVVSPAQGTLTRMPNGNSNTQVKPKNIPQTFTPVTVSEPAKKTFSVLEFGK